MPDGSVQLDRKSYPQNWKAYNSAQCSEKTHFLKLLHALCAGVEDPYKQKKGRPRLPLNEAIFAMCYKIYSTVSARRFMSDLQDAKDKGYISRTPHFNSVLNYLEDPLLTDILCKLVVESSLPLQSIETDFAADSSGFTVSRHERWFDHKYGVRKQNEWVKVHIMCGVKTNIITAVEIHHKSAADTRFLPSLLMTTAMNFDVNKVLADRGYTSRKNYRIVDDLGATAYIPFKSDHTGAAGGLWAKMYHYFRFNQEEFMRHYHQRSNVETTFSMIKAKFGGYVRSKSDVAMKNEVLAKVVCHNVCVLIQEMHELGIETTFWNQRHG